MEIANPIIGAYIHFSPNRRARRAKKFPNSQKLSRYSMQIGGYRRKNKYAKAG
jgi:hypothetical protein